MKKGIFLTFILSFILIQSAAAFNEQKPFSLELEYFAPDEVASNVDSMGALGLRFSYLRSISDNFEAGGSLGYIMGPNAELNSGLLGSTADWERDMSFIRLLGELKTEIPLGGNWKFNPGLSAGMAFGNISYSGGISGSDSWSGFAWEISAPFVYNDYLFAIKYAGFPTGENSDEWNTFGLSVGLRFGLSGGGASSSRRDYDDDEYKPSEQEAKRDFKPTQDFEEEEDFVLAESYESYVEEADDSFSRGAYMEAAGQYTGALRFLEPSDKRRIYILERQGTALGKQDKFEEGIKLYMAAIKVSKNLSIVDRNVVNAYLGLSYCLARSGNIPWAIINYKSARELTKSESLKLKIEEVLEGLKAQQAQ
jgi:tetratricopeptide (TPR) repeat protein